MSKDEHSNSLISISVRSARNAIRVAELLGCAAELPDSVPRSCKEEILRAEVVFMHAILEDAIREISRLRLAGSSTEILDTIPLVGTSLSGHARKISLGELDQHRDKTVEELIQDSVSEHLDRMSFSCTTDIARILEQMRIDLSHLRKYFPAIDEAISRRHQIVHRADMDGDGVEWRLNPIYPSDVKRWSLAVGMFVIDLISHVTDTDMSRLESEDAELQEAMKKLTGLAREAGVF